MIINVAVGLFNTKFEAKSDEVMISASPPFTIAYSDWLREHKKGRNLKIEYFGDDKIDWIRSQTKKRKTKDNGVINQYVVASGLVRTLTMLKNKWVDGMELVGIKTDAIYLNEVDKETLQKAIDKDSVVSHFYKKHSSVFKEVHPKFYDYVSKQLHDGVELDKLDIPKVECETLDLIKQYPYKVEPGKRPPNHEDARMDALLKTVGVVMDKSEIVLDKLDELDEKEFSEYLNTGSLFSVECKYIVSI